MTTNELRDDTLDLLYDDGRGQAARQVTRSDALDSKGLQLFSAGSIVVGLSGLGISPDENAATIALGVGLGFYLAMAVTAFALLRVRSWRSTGQAHVLWNDHWMESPSQVKHAIVVDTAGAVAENHEGLNSKARWLIATHVLLSLQVVSVVVAVILSRLGMG